MAHFFYDLFVDNRNDSGMLLQSELAGWSGVCVAGAFEKGPFYRKDLKFSDLSRLDVLSGAEILTNGPSDIQKKSRAALDSGADIVLVSGGSEEINRAASECWDVDILMHPEKGSQRDLPDQKNSGMDHVTARFMAEKGIALGIDFSELLDSYGMGRSQIMGRIRQNIMLAKKYGTPIILTSGASDKYGMRSPMDMYSVGIALGMDPGLAKKALSDYPAMIVKKARDRKDTRVITAGLEVLSCGQEKNPDGKKVSGWY